MLISNSPCIAAAAVFVAFPGAMLERAGVVMRA